MVETPIGPSVLPGDWDGDGVSDTDEVAAGTDPWRASTKEARAIAMAAYEAQQNGIEDAASGGIFNIAGYWTLGIIKGVSVVFVPIIFVGLATGFMMKVVQTGAKIGAME